MFDAICAEDIVMGLQYFENLEFPEVGVLPCYGLAMEPIDMVVCMIRLFSSYSSL